MMPIAIPIGVEIENKKVYRVQVNKGQLGSMRISAMPIAIAAKILCKDMVQSAFHASAAVSAHSPNIQNHVGFFSSAWFDHVNSNVDAKVC